MQEDMAPMEYMSEVNPGEILIFRWNGGSTVDIGRPQTERLDGDIPEEDRGYVWDQCFKVYDYETGKVTIPPEYEAFKAKCLEWLEDQREYDVPNGEDGTEVETLYEDAGDGTETEIY